MKQPVGLTSCYFNPCKYQLRRQNFQKFCDMLGADILIVELAFEDQKFDFEHLPNWIGLRTDTVVWQKEALLNIGLRKLMEQGYDKLAWVDGDIQFNSENWLEEIAKALDKHKLVQGFETIKIYETPTRVKVIRSTIASIDNVSPATGFIWAAREEVLSHQLLYPKLIVGGGDTLMYSAAMGTLPEWMQKRSGTLRHTYDILEWANKWYDLIGESVGYAEAKIETFYHGHLRKRNYLNRHELLKTSSFDPAFDII